MEACIPSYSWDPPAGWTGPDPVVYRSFDNLECITLMEGTEEANFSLISGKVQNILIFKKLWQKLSVLAYFKISCNEKEQTLLQAASLFRQTSLQKQMHPSIGRPP